MKTYTCPCGGELILKYESRERVVLGIFDIGKDNSWLNYECVKCKERFTTTESDTISFNFPKKD